MNKIIRACSLVLVMVSAGCTLSEAIPATELEQTERGVFSASGRYFVIGVRPDSRPDKGGYIVEITKSTADGYSDRNLVAARLEGTADGTLGGAPQGDPCFFSGMAAHGELLYAACVADDARAALLEVDLSAGKVRAGYFTSCNFEPNSAPCTPSSIYPNGMSVDAAGRIYVTDTFTHLTEISNVLTGETVGSHTLTQIEVDRAASSGAKLVFKHRAWFNTDLVTDGLAPNGVQIEGDILYYAAGSAINKLRILPDGSAGEFRVHYQGSLLSMIDDFALRDGKIALARVIAPGVVGLSAASGFNGTAHELRTYPMDLDKIPSSAAYQPESPAVGRIFPKDALILTSYFGGGLYVLTRDR